MAKWLDVEDIRMAGNVLIHEERNSGDKLYSKDMEHEFPDHEPGGVNNRLQRFYYARDRSVPKSYTAANKKMIDKLTDTLIAVGVNMEKTPLKIRSGKMYGDSTHKTPGSHISSRPGGYRFGDGHNNIPAPIFVSLTPKQKLEAIVKSPNLTTRIKAPDRVALVKDIHYNWVLKKGNIPVGGHLPVIDNIYNVVVLGEDDKWDKNGYKKQV